MGIIDDYYSGPSNFGQGGIMAPPSESYFNPATGSDVALPASSQSGAFDVSAFLQGLSGMQDSVMTMGQYGGDTGDTGVAGTLDAGGDRTADGGHWYDSISKAVKWFDGQGDFAKGAEITLAGSFIKGLFSYGDDQRKIKALEKSSDAAMLNAQTNADKTAKQFDNASAIGKTNFGAKPAGLMFSDKLKVRQNRTGYGS